MWFDLLLVFGNSFKHTGFPILEDCIYDSLAWGTNKGKYAEYGKTMTQLIDDVSADHSSAQYNSVNNPGSLREDVLLVC